jgi:thymidine kinase
MGFTLFTGCMFASKTTHLIREVQSRQLDLSHQLIIKHVADDRYHRLPFIQSHDHVQLPCITIAHARDLLGKVHAEIRLVAIDEIQFFDRYIVDVLYLLKEQQVDIIAAGLNMDYKGNSFGYMNEIIQLSDRTIFLNARCEQCGSPATHTYRLVQHENVVLAGHKGVYEPRCEACFQKTPLA